MTTVTPRDVWRCSIEPILANWGVSFDQIAIEAGYGGVKKQYLTMDETCAYLGGITKNTLYDYMDDGLMPSKPGKLGGRTVFDINEVDRYMETKKTRYRKK